MAYATGFSCPVLQLTMRVQVGGPGRDAFKNNGGRQYHAGHCREIAVISIVPVDCKYNRSYLLYSIHVFELRHYHLLNELRSLICSP